MTGAIRSLTRAVLVAGIASIGLTQSEATLAQSGAYPNRAARLLVPFAPGGATDIAARLLGSSLEKQFGQPFLIENRPGAFTFIASDAVAKAAPDGYSLLFQANSLPVEAVLNKAFTVSPERDFTTVSMFSRLGISLMVNASLPVHNLRDLVAYAKANPGKINHGLAGAEPADVAEIKHKLGLNFVLVPYKGGPATLQALAANEVQFSTGAPHDAAPLHASGKARAIVYLEKTRHPLLPNVPTVAESGIGLDNFDSNIFFGLFAPAATPGDIVEKLNAATQRSLREPELVERLAKLGQMPYLTSVAEAKARVDLETRATRERLAAGLVQQR